ncbi:uncharacterized protein [Acropora muricata]|uniref:uncharacterized protein isoform X3 n=1 Tax=Acropora muricata TaxID=159855 RepID=UPI0034E61B45
MSGFSEEGDKSSTIRCFPVFDKRTCVSKAFYTSFYVAIGALFPYLPVYFKQLKLSSHQNGILIGIRPLIQFCATPIWGACADKFHKSKTILLISVLGWLVSNFLLLLVPVNKDPMLCDFYDMNYENGFSSSSNQSALNDFVRRRNVTLKHFCSRISPYLESMESFFLPTHRDFQEACGGDQFLFSVVNGLNCAAEVCVFLVSDKFLHLFGHINVIYLALFCYSIRFVYFYIIENPWYVLPAELLQGITTAAFWSSCVSYVGLHPGASNTVQGILNGVYMGLGFATGGLIGGFLAQVIGMKLAFLLYAFASFCFLIPFVLVNTFGKK